MTDFNGSSREPFLGENEMSEFFLKLGFFLIVFTLGGCSVRSHQVHLEKNIHDQEIGEQIKMKLLKVKDQQISEIEVTSKAGSVFLRGQLDTEDQMDLAIQIAELQTGVREVKSFLILSSSADLLKNEKIVQKRDRIRYLEERGLALTLRDSSDK